MAMQDLLNAINKKEEPLMSENTPIDYTKQMSIEDYSKAISQDPTILQSVKPPEDYMQKALQESNEMDIPEKTQVEPEKQIPSKKLDTATSGVIKDNNLGPTKETDLERLEKKLQELRDTDLERQQTASKYNFGAKAAAIIGDALSKYQTGAIQKNVKAPIQFTGPSLQQIMSMIGEVKAPSSTEQRQALIDRYKELKAEQKAQNASKEAKDAADVKYKRDLAMLNAKIASDEKIAFRKAAEPTFEEKKQIEADVKEKKAIAKENRVIKEKLDPAIKDLDTQIKNIDNAINLFKDKSGKTRTDLTGPILGRFPTLSNDRQRVEKALNDISLKQMTKTFEGMASAVNSNVEREFFQAAQASMQTNEDVNLETLEAMKTNLKSLREKSKAKLQEIEGSNQTKPHPITGKMLRKVPGGWEEVD